MSLPPRSATPGPRSTSATRGPPATFSSAVGRTSSRPPPLTSAAPTTSTLGPCGTAKTTNKVAGVVKQEESEVPNKDLKIFQTLKLSAQSSSSAVPETQKPAVVVGPMTPKAKPMPARRGDAPSGAPEPTQPMYVTGSSATLDRGSHLHHRLVAWWSPLNRLTIRRRSNFGAIVLSKRKHA